MAPRFATFGDVIWVGTMRTLYSRQILQALGAIRVHGDVLRGEPRIRALKISIVSYQFDCMSFKMRFCSKVLPKKKILSREKKKASDIVPRKTEFPTNRKKT